ncbi:MAG: sigma-70 family RNA polymerase sigma factor [Deltaproteobacteria bacterium]|nr:sigma-70 family RNA polymerase sigma factor [Deltaproteobacteria bacterium]
MAAALPARVDLDAALHAAITAEAPQMMGLCTRMMGNEPDAADVLQEAWLRAWRGRAAYRGEGPPAAWLRAIVVRECLRSLKWKAWRRWVPIDLDDAGPASEARPEGKLDAARIRAAAARLPAQQRVAFNLRHEEGWTVPEIALALDVSPETVKTHLERALSRVREAIGAPDG